ncbi:tetratricopeptide repeat protein [Gallaecimonas sp. GXIMD1310]|uniref:tetratricopeptide repeat protein n=1 Tax=Gallaecimonas sp. GXIMD1310 TaxID=3131926 RepID=UPI00324C7270
MNRTMLRMVTGLLWLMSTLAIAKPAPPEALNKAEAAMMARNYPQARQWLSQVDSNALEGEQLGHYQCIAGELTARLDRNFDTGKRMMEAGLDKLRHHTPRAPLVRCLIQMSNLYFYIGYMPESIAVSEQSVKLARQIKDKKLLASALATLGSSYREFHLDGKAEPILNKTIALSRQTHNNRALVYALSDLASIRQSMGKPYIDLAAQASDIAAQSNDVTVKARAAFSLAYLMSQEKQYSQATDALLSVYGLLAHSDQTNWWGIAASNLAETYLALGQLDEAEYYIKVALREEKKARLVYQRMAALLLASKIAQKQGHPAQAIGYLQTLITLQTSDSSPVQLARVAKAHKALALLLSGVAAVSHWQAYATLMDERLALLQKAKHDVELRLLKASQAPAKPAPPVPTPLAPRWLWLVALLAAAGLGSSAVLLWRRRPVPSSLPKRPHSGLPYGEETFTRLAQHLPSATRLRVRYLSPVFCQQPFYSTGYQTGAGMQKAMAEALQAAFPEALFIGEPDSFHYLVVLPEAEAPLGQDVFTALYAQLQQQVPGLNGLHILELDFPLFPHLTRVTELAPLSELLLLGLQLARTQGRQSWLRLRALPMAADAFTQTNVRQALINELARGYLRIEAGTPAPLTRAPDWAALLGEQK